MYIYCNTDVTLPSYRTNMFHNITESIKDGFNSNNSSNYTKGQIESRNIRALVPLIIIGVIVVIENAMVCLAFATTPKLRKRQSNILVFSQAVIDLLVGCVFIPWIETEYYTKQELHSEYMIFYILIVSLGNLLCLAGDRYLALIKPLKHHLLMNVSRTKRILIALWLTPLFVTMIPSSWQKASKETKKLASTIFRGTTCTVILLMCALMISMYIRVYFTAARSIRLRQKRMSQHSQAENRIQTTKKELRVAHLFGLLLLFFILAYTPLLYGNVISLLKDNGVIQDSIKYAPNFLGDIIINSLAINSVVNPILCLLLKKDYQLIVKRWLCLECVYDKRAEESQRSHNYCRTGVSDLVSNDTGFEAKRRLFGLARGKVLRQNSHSKSEHHVRFSCKDDMVALMSNRPISGNLKGAEFKINKNETHEETRNSSTSPIMS